MRLRILSSSLLLTVLTVFLFASPVLALAPKSSSPAMDKKPERMENMMPAKLFGGKVVLGTVTQIVEKTITVTQIDNVQTSLITTEITKFRKGGRKVNLADLKVGDRVVASGGLDIDGSFLVKTLVANSKVLKKIERRSFYGVVQEVSEKSFTIKHPANGKVYEVLVNSQTLFRSKGKKVSFESLKKGQRVVAMVIVDQAEITGRLVLFLPEKALTEPNEATPSSKL